MFWLHTDLGFFTETFRCISRIFSLRQNLRTWISVCEGFTLSSAFVFCRGNRRVTNVESLGHTATVVYEIHKKPDAEFLFTVHVKQRNKNDRQCAFCCECNCFYPKCQRGMQKTYDCELDNEEQPFTTIYM